MANEQTSNYPYWNPSCPGGHVRPEYAHLVPGYWYLKVDYEPGFEIVKIQPDELKRQTDLSVNPDPEINLLVYSIADIDEPLGIAEYGVERFLMPVPTYQEALVKSPMLPVGVITGRTASRDPAESNPPRMAGNAQFHSVLRPIQSDDSELDVTSPHVSAPFAKIAKHYGVNLTDVYVLANSILAHHIEQSKVQIRPVSIILRKPSVQHKDPSKRPPVQHKDPSKRPPVQQALERILDVLGADRYYRFECHLSQAFARRNVTFEPSK